MKNSAFAGFFIVYVVPISRILSVAFSSERIAIYLGCMLPHTSSGTPKLSQARARLGLAAG